MLRRFIDFCDVTWGILGQEKIWKKSQKYPHPSSLFWSKTRVPIRPHLGLIFFFCTTVLVLHIETFPIDVALIWSGQKKLKNSQKYSRFSSPFWSTTRGLIRAPARLMNFYVPKCRFWKLLRCKSKRFLNRRGSNLVGPKKIKKFRKIATSFFFIFVQNAGLNSYPCEAYELLCTEL